MYEWNETARDLINNTAGENRQLRGGSWLSDSSGLDASDRSFASPLYVNSSHGFRVASVPEPSTGLLVVLGLSGLLLKRRKTGTL